MYSSLLASAIVAITTAQVYQGGTPQLSLPTLTASHVLKANANFTQLALEDAAAKKDEEGGLRVGIVLDVNKDITAFQTDKSADGSTIIHRLSISSVGALGMGVNFDKFQLPEGASLFVYTQDKKTVRGGFTAWNHKANGKFAVMPVNGDTLVVEVQTPAAAAAAPVVVIGSVVHHYRPTRMIGMSPVAIAEHRSRRGFGDSGSCNVNSACTVNNAPRNVAQLASGVTMILTSSGSRLCSGSMINNANQDARQLYLTADHCGASRASAEDWILVFNYESADCTNPREEPSTAQTAQGFRLLSSDAGSDFGLLELTERIPDNYNVFLNGYDATAVFSFTTPFSISHPSGDIKKIATYGGLATPEGYFQEGDTHWLIPEWQEGVTEGGSSGSPIFDGLGRIRGQLHGGYAACDYLYIDYYGRTSISWERGLDAGLDPQRTNTRVVDGEGLASIRARIAAKQAEQQL